MTEHELDLLADHAAGLLDGTPEGDAVAARLATDPEWVRVYRALQAADEDVRAGLAGLPVERMPDDVVARLDASLAGAVGSSGDTGATVGSVGAYPVEHVGTGGGGAGSAGGRGSAGAQGGADVVDLSLARQERNRSRGRGHGREGAPTRRRAWQAGGAVAAGVAVLAAAGLGIGLLRGTDGGTAETATAQQEAAPDLAAPADPGRQLASGSDYSTATVPDQVRALLGTGVTAEKSAPAAAPDGNAPRDATLAVPPELVRLRDAGELARCLTAVGLSGRPLAVDYASFAGRPAVVLVGPGVDPGTVTAVVVGPDCGVGGADERYRVAVPR